MLFIHVRMQSSNGYLVDQTGGVGADNAWNMGVRSNRPESIIIVIVLMDLEGQLMKVVPLDAIACQGHSTISACSVTLPG